MKSNPNLTQYIKNQQKRINSVLKKALPQDKNNLLHQAMNYSVFNGGKRLRPILVYITGEALGGDSQALDIPASAIEIIHCFSLIHDDLPAMDDDDLRRGKPTCHKKFNEAIAILAGDALLALGFETLAKPTKLLSPEQQTTMTTTLAKACGPYGMALGQALDIANQQNIDLKTLDLIHSTKTGALLESCIKLGLIGANCKDLNIEKTLLEYAKCIGMAFQIHDDIIDIESNTAILGKPAGTDQASGKITYPMLIGMDKAKLKTKDLYKKSINLLQKINLHTSLLAELSHYIITRNY
jgi:farnesyl diphosphate synthase